MQILRSSTSKSVPCVPVFNDFDFQIALAQAWCKFCEAQLPKVLLACQFLTILISKSLSRRRGANFVDMLGSRSFAPPRFSDLPLRTFEATKLWKNTVFRAIPTRQNLSCRASVLSNISAVKHRCCKTYRQLSV